MKLNTGSVKFQLKVIDNLIAEKLKSLKVSLFTSAVPRQSFCLSNLTILCIYLSERLASLLQLRQECLT